MKFIKDHSFLGFGLLFVAVWASLTILFGAYYLNHHNKKVKIVIVQSKIKSKPKRLDMSYDKPVSAVVSGLLNAASKQYKGPAFRRVQCVDGAKNEYACSYIVRNQCRLAFIQLKQGIVTPLKSGRVPVPIKQCFVRTIFRMAGGGA